MFQHKSLEICSQSTITIGISSIARQASERYSHFNTRPNTRTPFPVIVYPHFCSCSKLCNFLKPLLHERQFSQRQFGAVFLFFQKTGFGMSYKLSSEAHCVARRRFTLRDKALIYDTYLSICLTDFKRNDLCDQ